MAEDLRTMEHRMKQPVICLIKIAGGHYGKNAVQAICEVKKEEYSRTDKINEFTIQDAPYNNR